MSDAEDDRSDEVPVKTLRLGDKFWVEPGVGADVAVEFVGLASWGLVHGMLDLPCRYVTSGEFVTVGVHIESTVRPYRPDPGEESG